MRRIIQNTHCTRYKAQAWACLCAALLLAAAERSEASDTLRAKLLFTGDLMVHQQQIEKAVRRVSAQKVQKKTRAKKRAVSYDFSPSFCYVKAIISSADLAVGNFETTLGGAKRGYTGYPCFSAPDEFADAVKDAGFDVLMTGNNHCLDRHFSGLKRTLEQLHARSLDTVGTYATSEDRRQVLIKNVNGIRVALVSWTYSSNGIRLPRSADWAVASLSSKGEVSCDLARARALSPDLIVALPHVGTEYVLEPPNHVRHLADRLLKGGAHVIVASHPHVLQPVEFIQSGDDSPQVIAWSMGNFISGQRTVPRDMGMMLELSLEKKRGDNEALVTAVQLIPTWVQTRTASGESVSRVLLLNDALRSPDEFSVRNADVRRLKTAHADFTRRILGREISVWSADKAYELPRQTSQRFMVDTRKRRRGKTKQEAANNRF